MVDPNNSIDMSLDQIIEHRPRGNRNNRGRGGNASGGGGGATRTAKRNAGTRAKPYGGGSGRPSAAASPAPAPGLAVSQKIAVSNLAPKVTQADLLELFGKIGQVKTASLNFTANGKSAGTATIVFARPQHAPAAIKEYHERLLDGKPMRLELIVQANAIAVLQKAAAAPRRAAKGGPSEAPASTGGRGKGRKGGAGKAKPKPKTQDQLDADMEAYMSNNAMDTDPPAAGINHSLANALV
ncbi:hypothetical protein HKX48_004256 [Thoreauomyces humboldtii]|nr:hypothetical protein HKX48_004256 [Thoreauomyces humboldtii]